MSAVELARTLGDPDAPLGELLDLADDAIEDRRRQLRPARPRARARVRLPAAPWTVVVLRAPPRREG